MSRTRDNTGARRKGKPRARPAARDDAALVATLCAWYERARRDLPWRRTRDPYAVWVSEIMLQQTRVDTAGPYWERFMARFPSVGALAAADLEEVLRHWAGLGYYSRARNLHAAARLLAAEHGGELPRDEASLRALPGVGRYTAGAIRSIAFLARAPLVDGNVARVLSRVFALEGEPGSPAGQRALWALAERLVPEGARASAFNQGLMELGATVCTPRDPACHACPLATPCVAHAEGRQAELPPTRQSRVVPDRTIDVLALRRADRLLVARRPTAGLWGGLWELPELARLISPPRATTRLGEVVHLLTHLRIRFVLHAAPAPGQEVRLREYVDQRWLPRRDLESGVVPLSTAARRVLALLP